jgi:hypothetical protein
MTETPSPPEKSSGPGSKSAQAPAPEPPPAELLPALAAFERGDFRRARRLLAALLPSGDAGSPEVTAAARALEARMAADPWAVRVGIAAAAVLALVAGTYI